jgi:hypothetical protein
MKTSILVLCLIAFFCGGMVIGALVIDFAENKMMGKYDLYNCVFNNANSNRFPQNPIMIEKIQDECVCFRENNYTNLMEVNCSQ